MPNIAVIGAGAFGGWTALHLVRMGANVTLFDAWGPGNARASSGGESRVIRGMYGADAVYTAWVARSLSQWQALPWSDFYQKTGALWLFQHEDTYARTALPVMAAHGLPVESWSVEAAQKRYPQIHFGDVQTVFFEPEAGRLLARQACQAVCEQFVAEGGMYHPLGVQPGAIQGGDLAALQLSDGTTFSADQYVFACGAWLGQIFPDVIGSKIQVTRQEVYYFGLSQGHNTLSDRQLPIWIDFGERLLYGIPGTAHRGFKVADDTRDTPLDPTNEDRLPTLARVHEIRQYLAHRFPTLTDPPLVEARVCCYGSTADGHYLLDRHPVAQNVWLMGGGSGHGFKVGPALGEDMAQWILGHADPDPFFAYARTVETGSQWRAFMPQ